MYLVDFSLYAVHPPFDEKYRYAYCCG